ncbi:U3 small nucleolar ribonucleoprotein [Diaporthe amygdali]|uniref:U3 small nucleolar ribonucleoprotein n=1 Tax=Phomopsis amygdali TaxID=1214568 RepID=UPI0022FE58EF|nr:U3 small nucleolar ribonucleoprotein [Diaporthe amygdali]KAJ0120330.1 U3 small nucleolar ribonucleoprotein [Diaporthe amygdali]
MAGEGSTSSSLTSTSHTLTHPAPTSNAMAATTTAPLEAASMLAFLDSLKAENRHAFLQPPASISTASLHWAKQALDAFAGQVSDEQQAARLRDRKRKREVGPSSEVLKIRKVHVDGFETGQVWQQTRRIINSALSLSSNVLKELEENGQIQTNGVESGLPNGNTKKLLSEEDDSEPPSSEEDESASGSDAEEEEWEDAESQQGQSEGSAEIDEDDVEDIEDIEDEEMQDEDEEDDFDDQPADIYVEDPHGLNDGFFSIDDFNKQSQYFEDQDAKADPFTDQADDDDEVDWHGDPFAPSKGKVSKNTKEEEMSGDEDGDDDEDDDAGPTFGDMDLNAPEGASDDEGDLADGIAGDMGLDLTANDIFYKDFFAPPPRKAKKGEKPRKFKPTRQGTPDERDMERAMDNVRRDLFDDVSDNSDEEDALSDASAGDPKSRRSAHERRQAKLSEEIRKMEAELVAKRAWTLSGEASASARPMNSLLEEDLDFEHAGKPIPVITEEVSEELEDLIKRRIIAGEFDGVPKRRPDADVPADVRRGLVELDDAKAKQSLAEIYEEDHVKATNPDSYVSAKDEKLRREEKEIEAMWKDISAKLDSLSSWHYKPKPAAPSLQVVSDVATVAMEDAQPTTAQGVSGGESMIAPQEVYNPTKDTAEKGEVVAKSGLPVARQEMSREDKLRRRRREKERIKKSGGETTTLGKKAQEKKDTMADLKKGGVKVINRKGEVMDMDGKKPQATKAATSGSFKL